MSWVFLSFVLIIISILLFYKEGRILADKIIPSLLDRPTDPIMLAVLGGLFIVYLGYDLFIKGVTGKASLMIGSTEIYGQLVNAAPGIFFAIAGVTIIWRALNRLKRD